MRESFGLAMTLKSCSKLLVGTCVLAAAAWAVTREADGPLGDAVAGFPVVNALTVGCCALIAYLLHSRGAAEDDARLAWLSTGYVIASVAMTGHLLGFPGQAEDGPLDPSGDGLLGLYLLAHIAIASCALIALGPVDAGRRARRWALALGCVAAVYCSIGGLPVPNLINPGGRYTAAALFLHGVVTALTAGATYLLWSGRVVRPVWAQPLIVASFGCSTWELVFHSLAGGVYGGLWWAAVIMKFTEFTVLAVGLLVGVMALTRTLERFTDDLLQRLAGEEPTAPSVQVVTSGHGRRLDGAKLPNTIDLRDVSPVFQPVVDLATGNVVGMEALARFPSRPGVSPAVVFAQAAREGTGQTLELAMVQKAIDRLPDLPPDIWLAVNLSPSTIAAGKLCEMIDDAVGSRLVVEITEHVPVRQYDSLTAALRRLKAAGVRVAVDDTGAGFATFRHVVRLRPDIIKLDISLTTGIDEDPVRRALAASIITFAGSMSSLVVAEGIETRQEREALTDLGVPLGQGYLLGRPDKLPLLSKAG